MTINDHWRYHLICILHTRLDFSSVKIKHVSLLAENNFWNKKVPVFLFFLFFFLILLLNKLWVRLIVQTLWKVRYKICSMLIIKISNYHRKTKSTLHSSFPYLSWVTQSGWTLFSYIKTSKFHFTCANCFFSCFLHYEMFSFSTCS